VVTTTVICALLLAFSASPEYTAAIG